MQRWQCPICNGTPETVIWSKCGRYRCFPEVFISDKKLTSKKFASHFRKNKSQKKFISLKTLEFVIPFKSDKAFKVLLKITLYRALSSYRRESIKIKQTVHLIHKLTGKNSLIYLIFIQDCFVNMESHQAIELFNPLMFIYPSFIYQSKNK